MGILEELAEKFAVSLDSTLMSNPEYNKASLQLRELYRNAFIGNLLFSHKSRYETRSKNNC